MNSFKLNTIKSPILKEFNEVKVWDIINWTNDAITDVSHKWILSTQDVQRVKVAWKWILINPATLDKLEIKVLWTEDVITSTWERTKLWDINYQIVQINNNRLAIINPDTLERLNIPVPGMDNWIINIWDQKIVGWDKFREVKLNDEKWIWVNEPELTPFTFEWDLVDTIEEVEEESDYSQWKYKCTTKSWKEYYS